MGDKPISTAPHPQQIMVTWGYSGGPLLFKTSQGRKVSGISSGHFFGTGKNSLTRPILVQTFQPLMPWKPWIKNIIQGKIDYKTTVCHRF